MNDQLETMDVDDIAKLFKLSVETIKTRVYRDPASLPPRMRGTTNYLWLKSQVISWLNAQGQNPELQQLERTR